MAQLNSVELLRSRDIEWGRSYLWEVRFPEAPAPFKTWFPATEVRVGTSTLVSHDFSAFMNTYKVPLRSELRDLQVTFLDDINHSLHHWIDKWIEVEILNYGKYLSPLEQCVKQISVVQLGLDKQPIKHGSTKHYWVYPEGSISFEGDSNVEPIRHQITFIICGELKSDTH